MRSGATRDASERARTSGVIDGWIDAHNGEHSDPSRRFGQQLEAADFGAEEWPSYRAGYLAAHAHRKATEQLGRPVQIYVPPQLHAVLATEAERRNVTITTLVESSLVDLFQPCQGDTMSRNFFAGTDDNETWSTKFDRDVEREPRFCRPPLRDDGTVYTSATYVCSRDTHEAIRSDSTRWEAQPLCDVQLIKPPDARRAELVEFRLCSECRVSISKVIATEGQPGWIDILELHVVEAPHG